MAKKRSKYPGEESGGRSVGRRRRRHWRNIQIRVRPLTGQEPLNHQTAHSTPHCSGHLLPHRMTTERVWLTILMVRLKIQQLAANWLKNIIKQRPLKATLSHFFNHTMILLKILLSASIDDFSVLAADWKSPIEHVTIPQWILVDIASMAMTQEPIHWRYLPYMRPIFQAYVREYPHKIWPEIWYSTSICWILKISHWLVDGITKLIVPSTSRPQHHWTFYICW